MSDNPSYRGDQGQGQPADDYYDERYGRPQDEPRGAAPEPRAPYQPEQGGPGSYAPPNEPGYPPRGGYPEQGGYQQGYAPSGQGYEQRPPAGYGGGYDQGYRQPPPGYGPPPSAPYGPPPGGQGHGAPSNDYDYGRPPGRHEEPGYGRPEPRPAYPDYERQQGYGQPGNYGRPEYGQPEYPRYDQGGYPEPAGRDYDYGQPAGGGYGGYNQPAQPEYPSAGHNFTLQLDDGSGRTYQLREGANVVGRGQDAQFRLPDTGVSRRHLEIRWDGQVALLSDLNSTNGTTVNNAPVQEWQLADGDVIRLGHSEIVVRVH